jgi:hypothetical protein
MAWKYISQRVESLHGDQAASSSINTHQRRRFHVPKVPTSDPSAFALFSPHLTDFLMPQPALQNYKTADRERFVRGASVEDEIF